jgi:endogenous inhibitor of DNA gyrase (YacG/DUF329 family)
MPPTPTACPVCAGPVRQPATGRPRVYCSRSCQGKHLRAQAAARPAVLPGEPGSPLRTHADRMLQALQALALAPADATNEAAARLAQAARDVTAWADTLTAGPEPDLPTPALST